MRARAYTRTAQTSYDRAVLVHVKPTSYKRKGKLVKRKGYTYKKRDIGKLRRGPKLIIIKKPGALRKHGYSVKKSETARRKALASAIKEFGSLSVYRKLLAQSVYRKNYDPETAGIFRADAEWVRSHYKMDGFVS
jgi:hypothetical protein